MIGLAYLDEGARNFFTTDRPVRRLEDMKGLKIRVQVASMMGDTVEALGAEAVPIAYAELYTCLLYTSLPRRLPTIQLKNRDVGIKIEA